MIKDKVNLNQSMEDLGVKCFSCGKNEHLIQRCPLIKYVPLKNIVIESHLKSLCQERLFFKRKFKSKKFTYKSLYDKNKIVTPCNLYSKKLLTNFRDNCNRIKFFFN